jgi:hypothetical protein
MNIKTQNVNEFDFPLQKKENLLKKINKFDFDKPYVLNYDLLDFIIESSNYSDTKNKYFIQLSSETDTSIKFIDGFIERTGNIEKFIKYLCKEWFSIWDFISNESLYTKEKLNKYFKLIIEHAEVNDIKKIFANSIKQISNNKDFLSVIKDENKLKQIIKELDIKFSILDKSSPQELLDYVYVNNYYSINIEIVKFFFDKIDANTYKDIFEDGNDFETKNYSAIKLSKLDNLINYIDDNINKYVTSVYLNIDENTNEDIKYYIQLLNNKDISMDNKIKIIHQVETLISDISEIDDLSIIRLLLQKSKMLPTWNNLINIYAQNDEAFIDEMTSFINISENAKALGKIRIKSDFPDEKTVKSFLLSLLINDDIGNINYSNILPSIPYIYNSLSFESLSSEKVESLIKNNKLTTNATNFELLKYNFVDLSILLIEQNINEFIKEIDSFDIEDEDLLNLLKSNSISIKDKEKIINNYGITRFTLDSELLTQIGRLLLENSNINIDNEIILAIGTNSNLRELDKIRLFNKWNKIYHKENISNFLLSLNEPYSKIAENGKRPLLDKNELDREFVKNLKLKDYISTYKITLLGIRIQTYKK